jgi:hypothetical protein
MKKLIIILLIIFIGLSISCTRNIDTTETVVITETSIVTVNSIIEDTQRIEELEAELKQYQELIGNLNELLKNVYYIKGENTGYINEGTAFSIEYKDKFYLISAGHLVENEYGKFGNFKAKANFSDKWVYLKLLAYESDFINSNDYAVFYSDKIESGFNVNYDNNYIQYILGNNINNTMRIFSIGMVDGESGSPIVNIAGEVIGIGTGNFTDIDLVLEAIDNLK